MNIKMSDVFELPVEYRKVDGEPMLGDKNYHLVSFCDALTYEDGKGGERADYASVAINAYDSNQALIAKQQQTIDELVSSVVRLKAKILEVSCSDSNNSGYPPSLCCFQRDLTELYKLSRQTPAQSLASVKADAVDEYLVAQSEAGYLRGYEFGKSYANKLRAQDD